MKNNKIAILLCTYNGERYIEDQIRSILCQSYQNFIIYVSDDGSTDETINIIKNFQKSNVPGKIQLLQGPQKGYGNNFISNLKMQIDLADFFYFCDQDDIWNENKLQHTLRILQSYENIPALYCSVTNLIANNGQLLRTSKYKKIKPSFKNALCQSIAGGNTMGFNKNTAELFRHLSDDIKISSHDWLTYILVTSVGGKIYYDKYSYINYRQHTNNLVGDNQGLGSKFKRFYAFYNGSYRKWNGQNINVLENFPNILGSNKATFLTYKNIHNGNLIVRLRSLVKFPFFRDSFVENLIFYIGALFRLI